MAKLRGGFFSLSSGGSVGRRLTVRRFHGTQVGVQFSAPGGKPSASQSAVRVVISSLGIFWHSLSATKRAAWSAYAVTVRRRASGYEIYTEINFARGYGGQSFLAWPPGYPLEASVWEEDANFALQPQSAPPVGVAGLFEVLPDGDIAPSGGVAADTYFELDSNSDVQPKAA